MKKEVAILINLVLIIVAAFVIGLVGYYFWNNKTFVPENFVTSRAKSSAIAAELVSLLSDSIKSLDNISNEDRNYRFSSALDLVEQETKKIEDVRSKALELSDQLNQMAQAVQGIKPVKAKNLALKAVSEEVSLMSRLVNYNSYFGSLMETLRLKFMGDIRYDSTDVQVLIENMNKEAKEINSINDTFNQDLKDFDKIVN